MEEEKSSVDVLIEYAHNKGYECETSSNTKRLLSPNDSFLSKKFVAFEIEKDFLFIAKDSYAAKASSGSTFTGIYSLIDIDPSLLCQIHMKETLDFLFRWNRRKTGNKLIDRKLTITCNQKTIPKNLFLEKDLPLFNELYKKVAPVKILFENDYLPEFTALKGKMVVGIESNYWIYKEDEADTLIKSGLPLLKSIISRA